MIIAICNHKGGTGKTTTTINLGKALHNAGKKILLIDLDPQGNLSYSLSLAQEKLTIVDLLMNFKSFEEVACETNEMHVLPANSTLYKKLEMIAKAPNFNLLLKNALSKIKNNYDFILIDCPPSMSAYTINALNAADGVIIPMLLEILSIQGLDQIIDEIFNVQNTTNPNLYVIGALGTIVNDSRKLSSEVIDYVKDNYNINIFNTQIHSNVKAAEAPSFGISVLDYAPTCVSAKDYVALANELLIIINTNSSFKNN